MSYFHDLEIVRHKNTGTENLKKIRVFGVEEALSLYLIILRSMHITSLCVSFKVIVNEKNPNLEKKTISSVLSVILIN